MEIRTSCLTDSPLQKIEDDVLETQKYAKALFEFITRAETPVTIGIQGDWGSGKSSLITCLQKQLEEDVEHRSLCVLVNAWEHSLFQPKDSKAEITLSLLGGMAEGLGQIINKANDVKSNEYKWLDVPKEDKISQLVQSTLNGMWGLVKFGVKIGINYASGGTANIATQNSANADRTDNTETQACSPMAQNVHALKTHLEEQIKSLKAKDSRHPVRIVFFIDDLDRVPPSVAVEILDVTKNIFSIENCIFVLAVDYDVVVKGLESKFGKKTEENEREFRQYFDKIIQIPFSMPIGVYAANMRNLLEKCLEKLNYIGIPSRKIERIVHAAKAATGGVPRTVKRIINTLSLLKYISDMSNDQEEFQPDIDTQFIIVALHVNYPEILRRIMQDKKFTEWTIDDYNQEWSLNYESYEEEIPTNNDFDDEWEKVVYCLCAKDTWLKKNSANVSRLLNLLVESLGASPNEELSETSCIILENILKDIRVVSIESDMSDDEIVDNRTKQKHIVAIFGRRLHHEINRKFQNEFVPCTKEMGVSTGSDGNKIYYIELNDKSMELRISSSEDEQKFGLYVNLENPLRGKKKKELKEQLDDLMSELDDDEIWSDFTDESYGIYKSWYISKEEFCRKENFNEFFILYSLFKNIIEKLNLK